MNGAASFWETAYLEVCGELDSQKKLVKVLEYSNRRLEARIAALETFNKGEKNNAESRT